MTTEAEVGVIPPCAKDMRSPQSWKRQEDLPPARRLRGGAGSGQHLDVRFCPFRAPSLQWFVVVAQEDNAPPQ